MVDAYTALEALLTDDASLAYAGVISGHLDEVALKTLAFLPSS
jgi:hypothetical protein